MLTRIRGSCVVCLLSLLVAGGSLRADEEELVKPGVGQRIDDFFTRFEALGFHGTVLVATGDGVVLLKGYGFADRQRGLRNTAATAERAQHEVTAAVAPARSRRGKRRQRRPPGPSAPLRRSGLCFIRST